MCVFLHFAHLARQDVQAVSKALGVVSQLLDLVGYGVLGWMRQEVGRGGQKHQRVLPGLEQGARKGQKVRLLEKKTSGQW